MRFMPLIRSSICLAGLGLGAMAGASPLPAGTTYDPRVPSPAAYFGWQPGEWHLSHDQLAAYVRTVAAAAPERTRLVEIGRTHEGRPLLHLVVSAPANIARLEQLRAAHLAHARTDGAAAPADAPLVVWLGYSIHGNEASGSNAAPLVAYHLAAGSDAELDAWLANTIVIVDPSFNPDGLQRFSTWANMHRGARVNGDPNHREHVEGWPAGRFNHYWFDLNRDWLLAQHPESQARVREFQRWRPNVLADFHEMGSNGTYFFQPGVPSRQNPLTPDENLKLTRAIAEHHARAFDAAGALYYSEEDFDDFYYGKGSTYPDAQGAVGILFEQASARGHRQETQNGPLTFAFAIANHFRASLSTLRGAAANRAALLDFQRASALGAREAARRDANRAWLFGARGDRARGLELARHLARHGIEVRRLARAVDVDGRRYEPGSAWVVPVDQEQYRLIRTAFETQTSFRDDTFYDVSTWTLPLAYGLPYAPLARAYEPGLLGAVEDGAAAVGAFAPAAGAVAYAFGWSEYYAARALQRLHDAGVRVRMANRALTVATPGGRRALGPGAVVVTLGQQSASPEVVHATLARAAAEDGVEVLAIMSGLTVDGPDLGSASLRVVKPVKPLLVVGEGVDPQEAGEVWHLFDHRFQAPLTLVDGARLGGLELDAYTHVFMVDGRYRSSGPSALDERTRGKLKAWVEAGGTLVATKGAVRFVADAGIYQLEFAEPETDKAAARRDYVAWADDRDRELLAGAIFAADLDVTHPLAWGLDDRRLATFRDHTAVVKPPANRYATVAAYAAAPLVSGYASADNVKRVAGSALAVADRVGQGRVIAIVDDPNFRAFWWGTSRLLVNALYLDALIERTGAAME